MIPLFFNDFKRYVRNVKLSGFKEHPILYWEDDSIIYFYLPFGTFIYFTNIEKISKPDNIDVEGIKIEFEAIQIPFKLNTNSTININGTIN